MKSEILVLEWTPGAELDNGAMNFLRALTPKQPKLAPGEAWFMSEQRKRYSEFVNQPIADIPVDYIIDFLVDITGGIRSFPEEIYEIEHWTSWYKHLLPALVERSEDWHRSFLLEAVITAFMQMYPGDPDQDSMGLRKASLQTIGTAIMKPEFWEDDEPDWALDHDWWAFNGVPSQAHPSGALCSSMFFCLTYLRPDEVAAWARSVFRIKSVYFRAHLLTWLAGAYEWLMNPSRHFRDLEKTFPRVEWANSDLIYKSEISVSNESAAEFLNTMHQELPAEKAVTWFDEIWQVDELSDPLQISNIGETLLSKVL